MGLQIGPGAAGAFARRAGRQKHGFQPLLPVAEPAERLELLIGFNGVGDHGHAGRQRQRQAVVGLGGHEGIVRQRDDDAVRPRQFGREALRRPVHIARRHGKARQQPIMGLSAVAAHRQLEGAPDIGLQERLADEAQVAHPRLRIGRAVAAVPQEPRRLIRRRGLARRDLGLLVDVGGDGRRLRQARLALHRA